MSTDNPLETILYHARVWHATASRIDCRITIANCARLLVTAHPRVKPILIMRTLARNVQNHWPADDFGIPLPHAEPSFHFFAAAQMLCHHALAIVKHTEPAISAHRTAHAVEAMARVAISCFRHIREPDDPRLQAFMAQSLIALAWAITHKAHGEPHSNDAANAFRQTAEHLLFSRHRLNQKCSATSSLEKPCWCITHCPDHKNAQLLLVQAEHL